MNLTPRQTLGKHAENHARQFLQAQGLQLISNNYRCYHGEIDLIMQEKDTIVFIEVRSRRRLDFGHPKDSVNLNKQRKIIKTALHYLQKSKKTYKVHSRFDIVAIHVLNERYQVEWIKNAFSSKTWI